MAAEIISDGIVNKINLSRLNLDKKRLQQQLYEQGVKNTDEVFYAEMEQDGTLHIDKREDDLNN
ncbi:YetF domain-containing protein [Bacillus sp. JCM 19034]|uniref:YetF domain-containing protein n=1 Tax=Bacillus sp. JCM 19034 TaxID=1481928 RepID=UPI0009EC913E